MPDLTVADALEKVYASLHDDNRDIDMHIAALKGALDREGLSAATVDPARLPVGNRQGRKLLQAYFRQRGVAVSFA